ncbi:NAD kinase [Uliginosibacterium sp. H3]|uniref:NAD kinase n=1 Tax=Uliginosibacterium silvisoli TaxID=3114758 RepID=A0ABU6KAX0_9RHOO|nr:NAD kinase [Uliginosibacterium sp. H3]
MEKESLSESACDFRTVALVGKYQSASVAEALGRLSAFLQTRGVSVLVDEDTSRVVGGVGGARAVTFEQIAEKADLAIVLGGDGTLLAAARRLAVNTVPLLGINQGRLGFLTDIGRDEMLERVGEILDGQYLRERRALLEAEVLRDGVPVFTSLALNDVVASRGEIGRMIEFELTVDGEYIYSQRSDGVIVATPTGSTAYALSANGPILHPRLAGMVLVPLSPHGLTYRPIALSHDSVVDIRIVAPHDARIHYDGQTLFDAHGGDCVRVRRSDQSVTLLHPPGYSYFAVLREKLHWSSTPRLS